MPETFVRVRALGDVLGVTERHIARLVKAGVIPRPTLSGYRLIPCVTAYIAFLKKNQGGVGDERVKKIAVQRQLLELEFRLKSGKLIDKFDYDQELFGFHRQIRDRLFNIPDRVAGPLAAETDQFKVYAMLRKELHEALEELSGVDTKKEAEERARRKAREDQERAERWQECKCQAAKENRCGSHPPGAHSDACFSTGRQRASTP